MFQQLIIQLLLSYLSSGSLLEVKNKRKIQTISLKSGCVTSLTRGYRLQEDLNMVI